MCAQKERPSYMSDNNMLGNITQDILFSMVRKEARLSATCKAANSARTAHRRKVKGLTGVETQNFLAVCKVVMDPLGDQAFVEALQEQKALAEKLSVPVGYQFDVFDELTAQNRMNKAGDPSEDTLKTKPFKAGVIACLASSEVTSNPHSPGSKPWNEWSQGFRFAEKHADAGDQAVSNFDEESADSETSEKDDDFDNDHAEEENGEEE